jgi:hypothetical protein
LEQVRQAAQQLVEDEYLLTEDLGLLRPPSASMASQDPAQRNLLTT